MSDEFSTGDVARYWDANAEAWAEQVRRGADVAREWLNNPAFLALIATCAGAGCSTRDAARATTRASSLAAAGA